jgi:DTW domain-containing protein YfiP
MTDETAACPTCEKPLALCVCEAVKPVDNKIAVVILRHPQEQDRILGTARIATLQLKNAELKTGLSWPNLAKVVGRAADPKRWGILYLGTSATSGVPSQAASDYDPIGDQDRRILTVVTPKGDPAPGQDGLLRALEGIILLDGNWQQAKALWWRNAWMLKCRRLVLTPSRPSLYGNLRREPRRESLSTIEAAALALAELQHDPALPDKILPPFKLLLEKARTQDVAVRKDAEPPTKRWTS